MLHKAVHFEIKALAEDGTFEGVLSPYGNIDEGGDIVERGAFTKTLQESGSSVPLLWQHKTDAPIGTLELTDMADGLHCKGSLVLDLMANGQPMVPEAFKAHALMKRRIVKGLSIGFDAIKAPIEAGVRHLKELKLWEGSVVTFPMNLNALISAVKAARESGEAKDDFATELQEIQLYAARYQMMDALSSSLREILYDAEEGR
jgi:HK97 family phage prohead protease